jgi:hypothetical protein
MSAFNKDLTIEKGRSFKRIFTFYPDKEATTPMDLTGKTFMSQVREDEGRDSQLVFDFDCGIEGNPTEGKVYISAERTKTGAVNVTEGDYDIVETTEAKTWVKGSIEFIPTVTVIPD